MLRADSADAIIRDAVVSRDRSECWIWPGNPGSPYPKTSKGRISHLALEADGRPRPPAPGNHSLHSCDTPRCWNPDHLRWGSRVANMRDAVERGRTSRGEARHSAKLTEADVQAIRARFVPATYPRPSGNSAALAAEFGVSATQIRRIARGDNWNQRSEKSA